MKKILRFFSWFFGIIFVLLALISSEGTLLGAAFFLIAAMFLLPPVRKYIYSITNKELSAKHRTAIVLTFCMFAFFPLGKVANDEAAERRLIEIEKEKQAKEQSTKEDFNNRREEIISSIANAIDNKNYQIAISQANRYLLTSDTEIQNLYNKAIQEQSAQLKAEVEAKRKSEEEAKALEIQTRIQELMKRAKKLPASEIDLNQDIYTKLFELNPHNTVFKEKRDYYNARLAEKKAAEQKKQEAARKEKEARIARFGEVPEQNPWDGSYFPVKWYLQQVAHDPDSIDFIGCTKAFHTEEGWLVGCDYRGRNAFGGLIKQSNWFTIVHNRVTKMHPSSAYNP